MLFRSVQTVKATASAAANAGNCRQKDVFIASTGVIGVPMDPAPIVSGIEAALKDASADNWDAAAQAIMTTDTYPKGATRQAEIGGKPVTLAGIIRYEVVMSDGTVLAQAATRTAAWKIAAIRLQEADDDTE